MPLTAPYWTDQQRPAMGSTAHLVVGGASDALVGWAFAELERLEACWSRFRAGSELTRLNARAGAWTPVSAPVLAALTRARRLWLATEGRFDPTVIGSLERLGYDRTFGEVPEVDGRPVAAGAPAPGFGAVEIDERTPAVRLPAGTRLDLGGIGKGLAADRVATGLVDRGAESVIVSLGGDVRAAGTPPEPDGWAVPVEDPRQPGHDLAEVWLTDGAVVTSTRRYRSWRRAGRVLHHVIDPATGAPSASDVAAVVVRGAEAWWAEGLAKAALIAGRADGAALLRRVGVGGWIVTVDDLVEAVEAPDGAAAPEGGSPCWPQ